MRSRVVAGETVLVVKMPSATNFVARMAAMATRLLSTGEKAAAVNRRRAFNIAVLTTMAPRKKTCGAK